MRAAGLRRDIAGDTWHVLRLCAAKPGLPFRAQTQSIITGTKKMKSIKLASAFALVVGLAAAGSAAADTGYITFKGAVNSSTCTISGIGGVSGSGADFTVVLPAVDLVELNTNKTAGLKSFGIQVGSPSDANCVINNGATISFDKGGYLDVLTGALTNGEAAGAQNTLVQLLDSTGKTLNLATGDTVTVSANAGGGPVQIGMQAQYYAPNGNATAGAVGTGVQYTVVYN
jgi:major type 1 subunit fimbrin (pilin)